MCIRDRGKGHSRFPQAGTKSLKPMHNQAVAKSPGADEGQPGMAHLQEMPGRKTPPFIIINSHIDNLSYRTVAVCKNQRDGIILLNLPDIVIKQMCIRDSYGATSAILKPFK